MTRRALVIGCGGTLGFAWTAAALKSVEEALDWDLRTADVLVGTSAGSELVAALGNGRTPDDLLAALDGARDADAVLAGHLAQHPGSVPPVPSLGLPGLGLTRAGVRHKTAYTALAGFLPKGRGDATWLREYGDALATADGWTAHPDTWIVAADSETGERVAFGKDGAPQASLGNAIAASWAIPGWFPPVEIGDRKYFDGGSVSSVSADLLLDRELDEVVVVAPMTSEGGLPGKGLHRVERLLRSQMTRGLDREVAALREAGVRVIRVEPTAEDLDVMGPNFMDLSRREATVATALRTTPARVAEAIEGVNA